MCSCILHWSWGMPALAVRHCCPTASSALADHGSEVLRFSPPSRPPWCTPQGRHTITAHRSHVSSPQITVPVSPSHMFSEGYGEVNIGLLSFSVRQPEQPAAVQIHLNAPRPTSKPPRILMTPKPHSPSACPRTSPATYPSQSSSSSPTSTPSAVSRSLSPRPARPRASPTTPPSAATSAAKRSRRCW